MRVAGYTLLVSTLGLSDADELMAVTQTPMDAEAWLTLMPMSAAAVVRAFSVDVDGLARVRFWGPRTLDVLTLRCVAGMDRLNLNYKVEVEEFETFDTGRLGWGRLGPNPIVTGPNGHVVTWRVQDIAKIQTAALALQEGFANVARAVTLGRMGDAQATAEIQRILRQKPVPDIPLGAPPKPKTRKIRVD